MSYKIRKVCPDEVEEALALALEVFMEFEATDYRPEGVRTFKDFISSEKLVQNFKRGISPMCAAFDKGKIIGIIGMRSNRTHINLVFVKKEYHRRGIATELFRFPVRALCEDDPELSEVILNSSPYGLPFYLHLGFVPQSGEVEEDGIRYTPLKYFIKEADRNFPVTKGG